MNFRECRLHVLHDLLRIVDEDTSIQKTFLFFGGIKNAVYYFKQKNVDVLGISGYSEISIPGVFEIENIEYNVIKSEEFIEQYTNDTEKDRHIYIIPTLREMLNTEDIDINKVILVGPSYFIVDNVDEDSIYFRTIDDDNQYYMSRKVYNKLNNSNQWIIEADFEVYQIDIHKLKINNLLIEKIKKTKEELLNNCINEFLKYNELIGDFGTKRIEGEDCYDIVINHLEWMKDQLAKYKDTQVYDKVINYVYLQLANFRKYVASGSDGYYRSEFLEILLDTYGENDITKLWSEVITYWRETGRILSQLTNKKYLVEQGINGLSRLVEQWKIIKHIEIEGMRHLHQLNTCSN